jgi:type II secretory pathway pseudopilin PulG
LGLIATFTIPKVLQVQQDKSFNSKAKEAMSTLTQAYQKYKLENLTALNIGIQDLTPYMNYVQVDSGTSIDDMYNRSTTPRVCGSAANLNCIALHNGAIIYYDTNHRFNGTSTTHVIDLIFDPDGKLTDAATTTGPGKSLNIILYYNGMLRTRQTMESNSCGSWSCPFGPANQDPPWFGW